MVSFGGDGTMSSSSGKIRMLIVLGTDNRGQMCTLALTELLNITVFLWLLFDKMSQHVHNPVKTRKSELKTCQLSTKKAVKGYLLPLPFRQENFRTHYHPMHRLIQPTARPKHPQTNPLSKS
jgi:hypothetical protein